MKQITIQTRLEENSETDEKATFLIPSNTIVFTKEMVEQLEIYQTSMRKELERYCSWHFTLKSHLNNVKNSLKYFIMKKVKVVSSYLTS